MAQRALSLTDNTKAEVFEDRYVAEASRTLFSSERLCRELIESENSESGLPGFKFSFYHV